MLAIFLVFYLAGTTPSPVILDQFMGANAVQDCEKMRDRIRVPENAVLKCIQGELKPNT